MKRQGCVWGVTVLLAAMGWSHGVRAGEQAYIGLVTEPVPEAVGLHLDLPEGVGIVVRHVDPEGPAAGIVELHDVLVRLDDQWLTGHRHLATVVRRREPGDTARLVIRRRSREVEAEVALGGRAPAPLPPPDGRAARRVLPEGLSRPGPVPPPAEFRERLEGLLDEFRMDEWLERMREAHPPRVFGVPREAKEDPPFVERRVEQRTSLSVTEVRDGVAMTLRVDNGDRQLKAVDDDGRVLFEGPVNTREEQEALPAELRERFREMTQRTRVRPRTLSPMPGDVL